MRNKPKLIGLADETDVISVLLARADRRADRRTGAAARATGKPDLKKTSDRR